MPFEAIDIHVYFAILGTVTFHLKHVLSWRNEHSGYSEFRSGAPTASQVLHSRHLDSWSKRNRQDGKLPFCFSHTAFSQTIIECLKYAATGELPPGAKTGAAFIHDPKVCLLCLRLDEWSVNSATSFENHHFNSDMFYFSFYFVSWPIQSRWKQKWSWKLKISEVIPSLSLEAWLLLKKEQ